MKKQFRGFNAVMSLDKFASRHVVELTTSTFNSGLFSLYMCAREMLTSMLTSAMYSHGLQLSLYSQFSWKDKQNAKTKLCLLIFYLQLLTLTSKCGRKKEEMVGCS